MVETLEELGISRAKGTKKGRLLVHMREDYIGKLVEYQHEGYILAGCSREYAYLCEPKHHMKSDISQIYNDFEKLSQHSDVFKVKRGHCFIDRQSSKSKGKLIEQIKKSKPDLDWRHYASQSRSQGTFVEGRDENGELVVCIEL